MTLHGEILLLDRICARLERAILGGRGYTDAMRTLWREHQDEMRRMESKMDEQATLFERTEGT